MGIREIFVIIIVATICVLSLFRPKWGMLGYIWFALMRPDFLSWSAGQWPYSISIAACVIVGSLGYLPDLPRRWLTNPFTLLVLLFNAMVLISVAFAVYPDYSWMRYQQFGKMLIMAMWIALLFDSLEDLRLGILVCGLSLGFYGLWHGSTGVLHGGLRINFGIGNGMMSDNNTFALGLAMGIPLLWYGREMLQKRWMRMGMIVVACTSAMCVVLTFSRGAALAMFAAVLLIGVYSKYKLPVLIGLGVIVWIPVSLVFATYSQRFALLGDFDADGSLSHRAQLLKVALEMWRDHPLIGVGFGDLNFVTLSQNYLSAHNVNVVHNSFMQALVHTGIFGFTFFTGAFLYGLWFLWRSAHRMKNTYPELRAYPLALMGSLVAYIVGSMAHPRYTFDFVYMLLMLTAVWWAVERTLPSPVSAMPAPAMADVAPPRPLPRSVRSLDKTTVPVSMSRRVPVGAATALKRQLADRSRTNGEDRSDSGA